MKLLINPCPVDSRNGCNHLIRCRGRDLEPEILYHCRLGLEYLKGVDKNALLFWERGRHGGG